MPEWSLSLLCQNITHETSLNSNQIFITAGGHGKRSDAPRVDLSLEPPQDKGFSNINKEIFVCVYSPNSLLPNFHLVSYTSQYPMNNELHGVNQMDLNNNDNRWKSKSEMPYIPLVNLLQRMVLYLTLINKFTRREREYFIKSLFFHLDRRIEKKLGWSTANTRNGHNLQKYLYLNVIFHKPASSTIDKYSNV